MNKVTVMVQINLIPLFLWDNFSSRLILMMIYLPVVVYYVASEVVNARVAWLALFESVILVAVSIFQVYYISSWFGNSKSAGGV